MSVHSFGQWLYATPLSTFIREVSWVIPAIQSIHILSVSVVIGSALVSDLRLAGVLAMEEAPTVIVRRYLPWMWKALVVLLCTGMLLILAEPDRTLGNLVFWSKMALVVIAFGLTLLFRRPLLDPAFDLEQASWRLATKPAAWLSLVVWVGVIFCGRWIAYT